MRHMNLTYYSMTGKITKYFIYLPPGINDVSNPNFDGPGSDENGFAFSHSKSTFCSTFTKKDFRNISLVVNLR